LCTTSFFFLSFSFCAAFTHVQSIVEAALPLAFSLLCPCCASLNLPQAALGFAPFHPKRKSGKNKNYSINLRFMAMIRSGSTFSSLRS